MRKIKESLGQKFLFLPIKKTFLQVLVATYADFFSRKPFSIIAGFVISELIEKKVLSKKTMQQFRYDFRDFSIYDVYLQNYDGRRYSRGFSKDLDVAMAKALGEVFERQFTEFPEDNSIVEYHSINKLIKNGVSFVHPNTYAQPDPKQIEIYPKFFSCNDDTILGWVKVESLKNKEKVYILAQDAYWGFSHIKKEAQLVVQGTNGCGGGYTRDLALQSALLEIYQRDIFFKYWYFNKSPSSIDLKTIPKKSEAFSMIENLTHDGFLVHVLDLSEKNGVPVVVVVLKKETTGWFLGADSSGSKVKSIQRALEEAFSVYMWTFQRVRLGDYNIQEFVDKPPLENFIDERVLDIERILLWATECYAVKQDDFLLTGKKISFEETKINADLIFKFIINNYEDSYVVEVKNKISEEYQYYSVKVLVPQAYNLSLIEKYSRPVLRGMYPQNTRIHPFP